MLVLGPTQSGKTTGLAIPALLEWEGPVVATSVKGDLVASTRGFRALHGRCLGLRSDGHCRRRALAPLVAAGGGGDLDGCATDGIVAG